jgi:hypothetical protein
MVKLGEVLDLDVLELLKTQGITFDQGNNKSKDSQTAAIEIVPEELIKMYEARIEEYKKRDAQKDETIKWSRKQLDKRS